MKLMILRALVTITVLAALSVSGADAAQRKRFKAPVLTEQEKLDNECRDSDLSFYKDEYGKQFWSEYQKDCAPRPAKLQKFREALDEYKKQCTLGRRLSNEVFQKHQRKDRVSSAEENRADAEFIKCDMVEEQLREHYLTLYELERQALYSGEDAKRMREVVALRCPKRASAKNLRTAFARCHIHLGVQESDGYDAWVNQRPESVQRQLKQYEATLKKQGLWIRAY